MKFKCILLTGLTVVLFATCSEDFLVKPSQADLTTGVYFTTQADFEAAVPGIYAPMQDFFDVGQAPNYNKIGPLLRMGDLHSDNGRYYVNNWRGTMYDGSADFLPIPDMFSEYWNDFYLWIGRANQVLSLIDGDIEWESTEVHDNLKGQALLLRAWAYWWLAQIYGDACIHLEPVTSAAEASVPLSPRSSIVDVVIADATAAQGMLPDKADQEPGRVTSGTATMLLAEIAIWEEDYATAETLLESLAGDYSLMANYVDCFNPLYKNNEESIFEIQYDDSEVQYSSNFAYNMFPYPMDGDTIAKLTGVSNPIDMDGLQMGYCIPSPELLAVYEAGDERYDATVQYIWNQNDSLVPMCVKYLHPHVLLGQANENLPIYRYAEALLYLAEAINEQDDGRQAEAMGYVNDVRNRAGLADNTTATTLQEVRDAILQERRIELAFEGKRFWDLVRFDILETVITPYGAAINADPAGHYLRFGMTLPPTAFTDFRTKFNIPEDERLYNSEID